MSEKSWVIEIKPNDRKRFSRLPLTFESAREAMEWFASLYQANADIWGFIDGIKIVQNSGSEKEGEK